MTYFGFLGLFVVIPVLVLLSFNLWRHGQAGKAAWVAMAVQMALAVLYTTPWDNYLVAHRVWYYNRAQVSGILLGYVPLEEYMFFVLEAVLVGLLWRILAQRLFPARPLVPFSALRLWLGIAVGCIWVGSVILLLSGWHPGTYLGLILAWALPPVLIQLAFGADILWHHRKLLAGLIFLPGFYLSIADAFAIRSGIWAIDPAQSIGLFIGSLPLEEAVFFFVTVVLLSFGMTLSLSPESRARLDGYIGRLRAHLSSGPRRRRMIRGN